jgi:hypothetical protein
VQAIALQWFAFVARRDFLEWTLAPPLPMGLPRSALE